ncbi:5-formyltetrahydrofolate cyclo-ligase [Aeromicrobium halocynthiae]|uniref:5-formyltetrahydrofolate cyclo-ligase n=1 Tax=Aeromicrobium halocynthiae TaxID=560557 RepID=A0ABN2W2U1_9ACTN
MSTPHTSSPRGDVRAAKQALREELLARRRARPVAERESLEQAVAWHLLADGRISRARRVAAYRSMPTEPGTAALLEALVGRGVEVVVPVVVGEHLDWTVHVPDAPTRTSALGVAEPSGARLGPGAVRSADVVVVPALAVDHAGRRLGRGAGYYDRALQDVSVPVVALLHADELLPEVPAEPHDVRVQMVVTETGVFRVPQESG